MNFLANKIIVIDAGHGGTAQLDSFRQGLVGLREETVNLEVALRLEELLKQSKARVFLTRRTDKLVSIKSRAQCALDNKADVFVSIHHNSSDPVDRELDFCCIFMHGEISNCSHCFDLAHSLAQNFKIIRNKESFIFSDQLLFEEGLGVLKILKGKICSVFGEFSFFSHPKEESLLKTKEYCLEEARSYHEGLNDYFMTLDSKSISDSKCLRNSTLNNLWVSFLKNHKKELLDEGLHSLESTSKQQQSSWRYWLNEAEKKWDQKSYKQAQLFYQNSLSLLVNSPQILKLNTQLLECAKKNGEKQKWLEAFSSSIASLVKQV